MKIQQKRVRNLSLIKKVEGGKKIRVAVTNLEGKKNILSKLGFSDELYIGETLLPGDVGPVSRKNANGDYIIHRDRPKEKHSRMIEWTYKQWSGKGETKEVTDSTEIEYERYQRTFIPPKGIEFAIMEKDDEKILVSPEFKVGNEEDEELVLAINILLEAFGECEVVDTHNNPILLPKVIRLNWEVLPKGKYPWKIQKERLELFLNKANGNNRAVIEKRIEEINKYKPDFIAVGTAGFGGYIVLGFDDKNLYVLESIKVNNATYILKNDWESISMLTKSEILDNNLHKARIIHDRYWYREIAKLLA
ncbi:hypothetical protein [Clostridium saccharobutylicum]|uniref:Uncharacterized protein n=1 Tax=Clostridium saccharobutylicum TaxID=169679 RepID=A0A1S8MNE3_CLOSA|nr:hypothetical protein [Clostridium saccharobutylicum]OOM05694.1 hypothetical protein CLOSAC_45640 [Clostridium saccharobutylicum]